MQRTGRWLPLLGVGVPLCLILGTALLLPDYQGQLFGIRVPILLLFVCAPLTSFCLFLCRWLEIGGADPHSLAGTDE